MARIVLNPAIQVISGNIAGFVYRRLADGSVQLAKLALRDPARQPSGPQAAQMQRFAQASARYARLIQDGATKAAYERLLAARGPMARLRTLVIGDIMKAPVVRSLDLSGYHGAAGKTIRIHVEDNVAVARVVLFINDETDDRQLETAEYIPAPDQLAPALEWDYVTTADVPAGHAAEVRVAAYDLAGNKFETGRVL